MTVRVDPRLVMLLTAGLLASIDSAPVSAANASSTGKRLYKCVDANGAITYTEVFDAAKCTGGGAQMNDRGVSVKTIDRAKTPEEIAADKERAAAQAAAKKAKDDKESADRVLTQSYTSSADIKRARDSELKGIDGDIATTELSRKQQENELTKLLAIAADQERAGKSVQSGTQKSIDMVRSRIKKQADYMDQRHAERVEINKRFDEKIARYEELKAAMEARAAQNKGAGK